MNKKKKLLINSWLSGGGAYSYSTEYQAVLTYATAQGYTLPSIPERVIADTYIRGLVSSGLWAERDVIWITATTGDRNFAKINYKNPGTFTLTEVSSPTFTSGYGFSSAGVGYLNTGFKLVTNGVNYTTTDCHFAIGVSSADLVPLANNNYVEFGVAGAGLINGTRFSAGIANGNTNTQLNSSNTKSRAYNGVDFGYSVIERRASAASYNRQRNYVVDTVAETFIAPNNGDIFMCAMNVNSTPSFHSPRHVSTLQLGGGLSDALALADAELWRAYINGVQGVGVVTVNATYSVYESPFEVIATRANYQFASDGYNIRWSSDYGATWTIRAWGDMISGVQMDYRYEITGAHIFQTGTLLFTVASKIYRSTDGLATAPTEISPKNADGSPYVLHTPVNSIRPGVNFGQWDVEPVPSFLTNGSEILVVGVYTNLNMGAAPVSIWYSIDDGVTFKLAYQFGQNTDFRDDGTEDGGTTGTLLGNASNTNICRHIHSVVRNQSTFDWYFLTGDNPATAEIGWYKFTYDENTDTWGAATAIHKPITTNEWKAASPRFSGTDVYFCTDGGPSFGIYKGPIASIGTLASFTRILTTSVLLYGNRINLATGFMITIQANNKIRVSTGFGAASVEHTVIGASASGSGASTMLGLANPDSRGYYKINVGGMAWSSKPLKTVFIKEN